MMHCMLRALERLRSSPFARHHASGIDDKSLLGGSGLLSK